jgi:hypothetical protein
MGAQRRKEVKEVKKKRNKMKEKIKDEERRRRRMENRPGSINNKIR